MDWVSSPSKTFVTSQNAHRAFTLLEEFIKNASMLNILTKVVIFHVYKGNEVQQASSRGSAS